MDETKKTISYEEGFLRFRENFRGLVNRAHPPREVPPHERLELGTLTQLAPEFSTFGAAVRRKVETYNTVVEERGKGERYAPTLPEFMEAAKRDKQPADFGDYVEHLMTIDSDLKAGLLREKEQPFYIEETEHRRAHTLVTGGSRSGKSELMKLLIHHYVKHPELGGVLVIDPHADMARQIARWQEFAGEGAERLVYLDAKAGQERGGVVPPLNPLVAGDATPDELATLAGQLADALAYFGGDGEGQTPQMQRLGTFCLRVLLEMKGNLVDLMNGLTVPPRRERGPPAPEPDFVQRGKLHADQIVRGFFANDWDGESYRSTRDALKRRLQTHLQVPIFRRMMTAPNPLNLEKLLNAGKVVVVNSALGGEEGDALGRFLMAQVAAIGRRRLTNENRERPPVHVFVDEATQLMAPPFVNILERFAKSGIWLTMGQHSAGDGGGRDFVHRVKRSTLLKFLGRTDAKDILGMVDISRDELPHQEQGDFVVTMTGQEKAPMLLRTLWPSPVAKNSNAMSEEDFAQVMSGQLAAYYRLAPEDAAPPPAPPQAAAAGGWVEE